MAIPVDANIKVIRRGFVVSQGTCCADHAIARALTMTTVGQPLEVTPQ